MENTGSVFGLRQLLELELLLQTRLKAPASVSLK